MRFTLFAILIFIITRGGLVGQPNAMVLSGATLYDGTGNSITNAIIVIKDGRLSAVGDRFTPVPVLAEASVLFAGMSKMNFRRFLIISTLSNLGISIVYAAVGAYSVSENSFLLAFAERLLYLQLQRVSRYCIANLLKLEVGVLYGNPEYFSDAV